MQLQHGFDSRPLAPSPRREDDVIGPRLRPGPMNNILQGRRVRLALAVLFAGTSIGFSASPASASTVGGHWLGRAGYDYGPVVLRDGGLERVWWCGAAADGTDRIFYRSVDLSTGQQITAPRTVLGPRPGSWDGLHVCDPTVVHGRFNLWGAIYTYAMYYTATNSTASVDNAIGVVFSNDGINWDGQEASYNPIIASPCQGSGKYGVGQAAAWNRDGNAQIQLFWSDTCVDRAKTATATDGTGVFFGPRTALSHTGAAPYWNNDFAVDSSSTHLYAAIPHGIWAGPPGKEELKKFSVYRMNVWTALSGGGTWKLVYTVSPAVTGLQRNFAPGFLRNSYGDMAATRPSAGIATYFGGDNGDVYQSDIYWRTCYATTCL